jgi:hypothetical protein
MVRCGLSGGIIIGAIVVGLLTRGRLSLLMKVSFISNILIRGGINPNNTSFWLLVQLIVTGS